MTPQSPVPRGAFIINMYFICLLLVLCPAFARFAARGGFGAATVGKRPNWRFHG